MKKELKKEIFETIITDCDPYSAEPWKEYKMTYYKYKGKYNVKLKRLYAPRI